MVQRYVGNTTEPPMRRVWTTTSTLLTDVHFAYHYQGKLSEFEETSRKLDAILYAVSPDLGIWKQETDEDIS